MYKTLTVITVTGLFTCLCAYSLVRYTQPPIVHVTWRTHSAAVLADVYGLSPDDVSQPVEIWRKPRTDASQIKLTTKMERQ